MKKFSWWNFYPQDYPEDHFQIANGLNWKQPRFIAFNKEDADLLCHLLNAPNQALKSDAPTCSHEWVKVNALQCEECGMIVED